jgi:hypothetical protein
MLVSHARNEDGRDKMAEKRAKAKKKRRGRASYKKGSKSQNRGFVPELAQSLMDLPPTNMVERLVLKRRAPNKR